MIKRRFFKQDHGDKGASDSSSSSDSSPEPSQEGEEEVDGDDNAIGQDENEEVDKPPSPSPGSGYETEDGSANDSEGDSSGLLGNDKEESSARSGNLKDNHIVIDVHAVEKDGKLSKVGDKPCDPNDPIQAELANCIVKLKSVFKCRLCPRIILLNENTVRTHLSSKRHARSKKLLGEGRLKLKLNSDGEIEEEQETHSERHARTLALAQELDAQPRKDKAHQRKRQRRKKDNGSRHPLKKHAKKRGGNCD